MTNLREKLVGLAAAAAILTTAVAPATAMAQGNQGQHRQKQKNDWRNLGYAGAALAGIGLLSKNGTLTTVGVAGGLYSAYRYEEDRKSQSKMQRQRAAMYSNRYVTHHGQRFERKTVWSHGKKFYKFVRVHK